MSKRTHKRGHDRRLRQRLFDAGNTSCPICLTPFTRADAVAGRGVTLEHAPPKSLGGGVMCLTCESCNNKASLVDHHAFLSKKARDDWSAGRGVPLVVGIGGLKKKVRFIPTDPKAPYPARKHLLRGGSAQVGLLPSNDRPDANKGISIRIPQRDDYEFVSMVKSAYLMVFSLMGANGYSFARNIGLAPVREQIMNPDQKILKGGFVLDCQFDLGELSEPGISLVFLCAGSRPPYWIVPMWNDRAVILPCEGTGPINQLVPEEAEFSIPMDSLAGWVSRRFDGSASLSLNVPEGMEPPDGSLTGRPGDPFPNNQDAWIYVSVFSQDQATVALPWRPKAGGPSEQGVYVVDMLSQQQAVGKGLDLGKMASVMRGSWGIDVALTDIATKQR